MLTHGNLEAQLRGVTGDVTRLGRPQRSRSAQQEHWLEERAHRLARHRRARVRPTRPSEF